MTRGSEARMDGLPADGGEVAWVGADWIFDEDEREEECRDVPESGWPLDA